MQTHLAGSKTVQGQAIPMVKLACATITHEPMEGPQMSTKSSTRTLAVRTVAAALIAGSAMLAVGCTSELPTNAPPPAPGTPQQR
jgi:hypothetical protein